MKSQNAQKSDDIEKRLTDIVIRVEKSGISNADKEELYAQISANLHHAVYPILMRYVSQEELSELDHNPSTVSIESFKHLMAKPMQDARFYMDANPVLNSVLDVVETGLSKGGM